MSNYGTGALATSKKLNHAKAAIHEAAQPLEIYCVQTYLVEQVQKLKPTNVTTVFLAVEINLESGVSVAFRYNR